MKLDYQLLLALVRNTPYQIQSLVPPAGHFACIIAGSCSDVAAVTASGGSCNCSQLPCTGVAQTLMPPVVTE